LIENNPGRAGYRVFFEMYYLQPATESLTEFDYV